MSLKKNIVIGSAVVISTIGLFSVPYIVHNISPNVRETRAVTKEVLSKQADYNRDGRVSEEERMGFYRDLATRNGVKLYENTGILGSPDGGYWLYDENRRPVPHDIVIRWLREYRPDSNQP